MKPAIIKLALVNNSSKNEGDLYRTIFCCGETTVIGNYKTQKESRI